MAQSKPSKGRVAGGIKLTGSLQIKIDQDVDPSILSSLAQLLKGSDCSPVDQPNQSNQSNYSNPLGVEPKPYIQQKRVARNYVHPDQISQAPYPTSAGMLSWRE